MQLTQSLNAYGFGRARRTGLRLEAVGKRNAGILKIHGEMLKSNPMADIMQATMAWDFNHAEVTTNAAQLKEIGVDCYDDLPEAEVRERLWEFQGDQVRVVLVDLIEGMADLGIFLVNTNHLSERELLDVLLTKILREQVRDLPPSPGVSEFIDLAAHKSISPKADNRDRFLPQPTGAVR